MTENGTPERLLLTIAGISLALILCGTCDRYLFTAMYQLSMANDLHWQTVLLDKTVTMDYESQENPEGLTSLSKAMGNCGSDQSTARIASDTIASFLANAGGIVSYAGVLTALSPWITLTVVAVTTAGFFLLKQLGKWSYAHRSQWAVCDRKLDYLRTNSGDFRRAKDLRLYRMTDWFLDVFAQTLAERMRWHKKEQAFGLRVDAGMAALSFLREGITYGALVFLIFGQGMTADEFVLYFGLIGGFATWLLGLAHNLEALNRIHLGVSEMREYLDIPDRQNHGKGSPLPEDTFSIEFQNVRYRYAGSEADTIRGLSFRVKKGEKIAVVGKNGSGKTTFIKLLCRLYDPTEGQILLNGVDIRKYSYDEYLSLFSVVFQDFSLFSFSLGQNVAASVEVDREKAAACLEKAGFGERLQTLPKGLDTCLYKDFEEDGVELSGGEAQKIALARALYKDAPFIILDEPTAALDPIAEYEVYSRFNEIVEDKTAVYISHRLSSCRFCGDIAVFDGGQIVQRGSHEELLAQTDGVYHALWHAQAQYYVQKKDA